MLTQRVGDRFTGLTGLSLTVPVAAATAALLGVTQASGHLTLEVLAVAAGLALLLPVLPFALELLALRHMTSAAFGTLMALEPAFGVLLGLLVLHQPPSTLQLVGILLVVLAGAAAQRGGRRQAPGAGPTGTPCRPSRSLDAGAAIATRGGTTPRRLGSRWRSRVPRATADSTKRSRARGVSAALAWRGTRSLLVVAVP